MSNETNAIDPTAQACWEAGADPATINAVESAFYLGRCAAAVNAADAAQESRDGPLADRLERERCAAIHELHQAIAPQQSGPAAVPDPDPRDDMMAPSDRLHHARRTVLWLEMCHTEMLGFGDDTGG